MDEIIETKKPRRAVKIFGKMIPVTVLALILGSGIGLATLGAYISNQMTTSNSFKPDSIKFCIIWNN